MPANAGASTRSEALIIVTAPLPETKLSCELEDPPPLQLVKANTVTNIAVLSFSRFILFLWQEMARGLGVCKARDESIIIEMNTGHRC